MTTGITILSTFAIIASINAGHLPVAPVPAPYAYSAYALPSAYSYPYAVPAPYAPFKAIAPVGPAVLPAAPVVRAAVPAPAVAPAPLVRAPFPAAPVVQAAPLAAAPLAAPVAPAVPVAAAKLDYVDTYPQYQYAYQIQDTLTGDSKAAEEVREGGVVKGRYSLIEADGSRRTVNYYADPLNGFNAVVQKDLPVVAAPVVKAAPTIVSV